MAKQEIGGGRPDRRLYPLDKVSAQELLGKIVIAWNGFEWMCRRLLNELCGNPPGIEALTTELNGQSLYFALRAAAPVSVAPELGPVVQRLSEALDRLKDHRNYYVHGALEVRGATGKEQLILQSGSAKSVVKAYQNSIDKQEMKNVADDCDDLALEAFNLLAYLLLKKQGREGAVPDMPFLPPKMEKNPRTPR